MSDKTRETLWIYKGKAMDLQVKNNGFSKGLLLACKRTPFGVQKESFLKGIVLSPNSNPYPAG